MLIGFGGMVQGAVCSRDMPEVPTRVQQIYDLENSLLAENALKGINLSDWVLNPSRVDSVFEEAKNRRSKLDSLYNIAMDERTAYDATVDEIRGDCGTVLGYSGVLFSMSVLLTCYVGAREILTSKRPEQEME